MGEDSSLLSPFLLHIHLVGLLLQLLLLPLLVVVPRLALCPGLRHDNLQPPTLIFLAMYLLGLCRLKIIAIARNEAHEPSGGYRVRGPAHYQLV